jgi:hypothetical protein
MLFSPTPGLHRSRGLRSITVIALAASLGLATTAGAASGATKRTVKKKVAAKSSSATKSSPAVATFDLNVCSYVTTETVGRIIGVPVRLDTSPGDAGTNTHLRSATFEQCVYVADPVVPGRDPVAIVHVKTDGADFYAEERAGQEFTGTNCPAACADVAGLGDAAFATSVYGVGGGFIGRAAFVISRKGSAKVLVAVTPTWPDADRTPARSIREVEPLLLDTATRLNGEVLALVGR